MLNNITIMGRFTRDPELRRTAGDTAVTSFTLAVDRDRKNADGEREADFIECVAWRGTAEFVSRFFTKGQLAVVNGRLQSRKWQDKSGADRMSWEVIVIDVYFGSPKAGNDSAQMTEVTDAESEEGLPF